MTSPRESVEEIDARVSHEFFLVDMPTIHKVPPKFHYIIIHKIINKIPTKCHHCIIHNNPPNGCTILSSRSKHIHSTRSPPNNTTVLSSKSSRYIWRHFFYRIDSIHCPYRKKSKYLRLIKSFFKRCLKAIRA